MNFKITLPLKLDKFLKVKKNIKYWGGDVILVIYVIKVVILDKS